MTVPGPLKARLLKGICHVEHIQWSKYMSSFIICYLIVWIAVTSYIAYLGACQAKLKEQLEDLKQDLSERTADDPARSHAA